jgi:hypothetical protein
MTVAYSLPTPDEFGNYWLSGKPATAPAIFRLLTGEYTEENGRTRQVRDADLYAVSIADGRMLWQGGKLRAFANPRAALRELKKVLK